MKLSVIGIRNINLQICDISFFSFPLPSEGESLYPGTSAVTPVYLSEHPCLQIGQSWFKWAQKSSVTWQPGAPCAGRALGEDTGVQPCASGLFCSGSGWCSPCYRVVVNGSCDGCCFLAVRGEMPRRRGRRGRQWGGEGQSEDVGGGGGRCTDWIRGEFSGLRRKRRGPLEP